MNLAEVTQAVSALDANALRKAAKQQRAALELRPWKLGLPTHDVLGNALCFKEEGASMEYRYWIALCMSTGAHIRVQQCGRRFQVFAKCEADAKAMADTYATSRRFESLSVERISQRDGWAVVEFCGQRRALD